MKKTNKLYCLLYLLIVMLFMYLPIIIMAAYSFNDSKLGVWKSFTLKWYEQLLNNAALWEALQVTVYIAIAATVFSTIFGTLAAIGISYLSLRKRSAALTLSNIPVINPDIVTGVSLMLLFVFMNISNDYFSLFLAHSSFCVPYVVLAVMPKINSMDPHLFESALDLGATPLQAIRKVVLPQIRSGVITGALLSFTLSLDDFAVSYFVSDKVNNLSVYIYSAARKGVQPDINAVSVLMFVCITVLLLVINKRTDITELY